jgi:hypothetical protein
MNTLFWLSFFFSAPPHHNPTTCATSGTPLLEIRERSETSTAITTKKIYSSGGWTLNSDDATARGCFDRKELRTIRRALQRAAWKVTSSPIACFAYDPSYTEYLLHGKLRYTHRMCSGKTADTGTLEAIDLVNQELADELPPPPPAPPVAHPAHPPMKPLPPVTPLPPVKPPIVKPPVATCSASGTPLFEIKHRSERQEPTSITSIYSNGAWTFQPIDKDGQLGALARGCFAKPTLLSIRRSINRAPWDVTFSRVVCKAYSPSFTEYSVHGKYEYTARLCGAQRIDAASAEAIKLIEAELATVLPARG